MSEENKNKDGEQAFSLEYVKELREENAKWRNKVRDLEGKVTGSEIKVELDKRGIKADPSWIKLNEGETASVAVDKFVVDYPHLVPQSAGEDPPRNRAKAPKAMSPGGSNTNTPGPSANGSSRTFAEIKKDPVARASLREKYREMLRNQSHQKDVE